MTEIGPLLFSKEVANFDSIGGHSGLPLVINTAEGLPCQIRTTLVFTIPRVYGPTIRSAAVGMFASSLPNWSCPALSNKNHDFWMENEVESVSFPFKTLNMLSTE